MSGNVITLRNDLKEIVDEITFDDLGLVGDKIAPPILVTERASTYPVLPKEAVSKVPNINRGSDGTFSRGQWEYGDKSYTCKEGGHEETAEFTSTLINSNWVDEEEIAATLAKQGLLLGNESILATALFNETTWAGTALSANPDNSLFSAATDGLVTIVNEMDDATNAAPFKVFDTIYRAILRQKSLVAKKAYSAVMSDDLVSYIIRTNEVKESVKYTSPIETKSAEEKRSFLADYLELKEIIPVSAMFDTSGLSQDARIGKFWSNEYCLLGILSKGLNTFKEKAVARQPVWSKYSPTYLIEQYPEPQTSKMVFRARQYRGVIVNTDYGVLIKNMKTTVDATTGI